MIESYFNQVKSHRAPRPRPPGVAVSHKPPSCFEQESDRGSRAKYSIGSVPSVPSCKIRGFFASVFPGPVRLHVSRSSLILHFVTLSKCDMKMQSLLFNMDSS